MHSLIDKNSKGEAWISRHSNDKTWTRKATKPRHLCPCRAPSARAVLVVKKAAAAPKAMAAATRAKGAPGQCASIQLSYILLLIIRLLSPAVAVSKAAGR